MLCGFFLGISVIAPGVSGSIMAIMIGVYEDIINIISNPFKNLKRNFFYALPMGIGALLSLATSIKLLSHAFDNYPIQSQLLFMGLIAGGLIEIVAQMRKVSFKRHYIVAVAVSLAFAIALGTFDEIVVHSSDISIWYLCLAGGVTGVASLVPGMSVSLILMLFGVYDFLLQTASNALSDIVHFISVAAPMGVCFLTGMILLSQVIKFVFERYPGSAYFSVFGFMLGTLVIIFPTTVPPTVFGVVACAVSFLVGLAISIAFQFLGKKFNKDTGKKASD